MRFINASSENEKSRSGKLHGNFPTHYNAGESQTCFARPIISQTMLGVHGAGIDSIVPAAIRCAKYRGAYKRSSCVLATLAKMNSVSKP